MFACFFKYIITHEIFGSKCRQQAVRIDIFSLYWVEFVMHRARKPNVCNNFQQALILRMVCGGSVYRDYSLGYGIKRCIEGNVELLKRGICKG